MKLHLLFIFLSTTFSVVIGQTGICNVLVKVSRQAAPHGISDSLINLSIKHQKRLQGQTKGTGFLYKEESQPTPENSSQFFIITCNHVIERGLAGSIVVVFLDNPQDTLPMIQWGADTYLDIAILKFKKQPNNLQNRFVYPIKDALTHLDGNFILNTANLINPLICQHDKSTPPPTLSHFVVNTDYTLSFGMSGSPLLKNGVIIGIFQGGDAHKGIILKGEVLAYAVQSILSCPLDALRGRHIKRGFIGLVFAEISNGICIYQTIPNTNAYYKLKSFVPSTAISSINGYLIKNMLDARFIIERFSPNQAITITFASGESIDFKTEDLSNTNLEKIAAHYLSQNTNFNIHSNNSHSENIVGKIVNASTTSQIAYIKEPYTNYSYIVNKIALLGIMIKAHSDKNNHLVLLDDNFSPIPLQWNSNTFPTLYF